MEVKYRFFFASPLGWLLLAATTEGLSLVHFCGPDRPSREFCQALLENPHGVSRTTFSPNHPLLDKAEEAIQAYLHQHQPIPSLPLDVRVGTAFQRLVWEFLRQIPFGETRSYAQVAQALGTPRAPRAVGQACGRNPLPLFIPCHRVISADGRLGGFSGGLHLKQTLLTLEQNKGARIKSSGNERFVVTSGG